MVLRLLRKPDISKLSLAEKRKLLTPSKPAPKRGDHVLVKVFSDKITSRALGTRVRLGVQKKMIYTGDTLSVKTLLL